MKNRWQFVTEQRKKNSEKTPSQLVNDRTNRTLQMGHDGHGFQIGKLLHSSPKP
jgi:hypothetical protein